MNAYQIPTFNAGPTPASPFNAYFPQNTHHSYAGVISSSYGGSPRGTVSTGTNLNHHGHHNHHSKTMTTSAQSAAAAAAAAAAATSFVSPGNYFHHQSHHHPHPHHPLQPFSTFTTNSTVQSPSAATTNLYAHNHYNSYSNGSSTTTNANNNMANSSGEHNNNGTGGNNNSAASSASSGTQNNFDYGVGGGGGYNPSNSTTVSAAAAAAAAAYPYSLAANHCPSNHNNSYSSYSPNSPLITTSNNSSNNQNPSTLTYQSSTNPDSYLSLCSNNNRLIIDNNEDLYTLTVPKIDTINNTSSNTLAGSDGPSSVLVPPTNKKAKRSGRGRTRRQINIASPTPENNIDRIFIWYIDETILSYLSVSEYNRLVGFNDALATSLYNEIFMFINKFAEKYLFLSDLKDIDQSHIDDSAADDNGQDLNNYNFNADGFKTSVSCNMGSTLNSADLRQKMALRYRKISETYSNYCDKLDELILDKSDYEQLQDLIKRFDLFSKNWIHPAIKALSFIKTRPNCLNVLISSSPLIYTLSKLMVFNLAPYFSIGNVYSCSKTSKEHTLNRVLSRFGSSCTYIVIGKGSDEQQLSQKLELPFWPITEREHFESLLNAMHYFF